MLSVPHLIIIFLVALVVLGPEKLPEVARVLGKVMADFRKVSTDFRTTLEDEMREIDRHLREKERLAKEAADTAAKAAIPALPEATSAAPALPSAASADSPATEHPAMIAEPEDRESAVATTAAPESEPESAPVSPPILPDPDARHINAETPPSPADDRAPISEADEHETPSDRAMTEK